MRGRPEGAAIDFGHAERGVVGCHDDVGIPGDADAATEAESVDRGDHRNFTVVDRGEHCETTAVHADHRLVGRISREFLDVDTGLEPTPLGADDHHVDGRVASRGRDRVRELVPTRDRQGVDRGVVDGDDGNGTAPL